MASAPTNILLVHCLKRKSLLRIIKWSPSVVLHVPPSGADSKYRRLRRRPTSPNQRLRISRLHVAIMPTTSSEVGLMHRSLVVHDCVVSGRKNHVRPYSMRCTVPYLGCRSWFGICCIRGRMPIYRVFLKYACRFCPGSPDHPKEMKDRHSCRLFYQHSHPYKA